MTAIGGGLEAPRGGVVRGTAGISYVEAADPMAAAFGGLALGTAFVVLFGLYALVSATFGVQPPALEWFQGKSMLIALGVCAAAPVVFFVFGLLLGKSAARR
jgi:hypothetical protein